MNFKNVRESEFNTRPEAFQCLQLIGVSTHNFAAFSGTN